MLRKDSSRLPKKGRKSDEQKAQEETPSVHKRNLYFVSFPVIFLFVVLRYIIYRLFLLFKTLGAIATTSSRFVFKPKCKTQKLEVEVESKENEESVSSLEYSKEMSHTSKYQPGPGDPLLVKQKHHHRRAFEYISKALKIDEENEGELLNNDFN